VWPAARALRSGLRETITGGIWQMAPQIECPRCGRLSASFIQAVCRACYMREYHQRRSAAALTQCPRCSVASANFVKGLCRACYMRDYQQRRSAAVVKDKQRVFETPTLIGNSEGQHLCIKCEAPGIYARGHCLNCYMRDRQRRQRQHHCVECAGLGIYARGLCHNCYMRDRQRRQPQRHCVECGGLGTYARGRCLNCYMRKLRHDRRIKRRVCAVCGVSFQSVRRDALYCSSNCGQKAHRAGKAQRSPNAARVSEQGAVKSAIDTHGPTLAPRIEVRAHGVADLDRRLGQSDSTIEEATKYGCTGAALSVIDGQLKARQALAGGDASTLPEAERVTWGAKGRQREAGTALIRDVAQPFGADTDGEWAIRWLLVLMALCCDPPARDLTAAARNGRRSDVALSKIIDKVV
jgi:hypothetical protein